MEQFIKEHFDGRIAAECLETPSVPRLSENAMWLLAQRYFVERYDALAKGLRKEASFEEFARRISRTIASAETQYLDVAAPESLEWLRTLEKNIANDILSRRFLFNSPCLFSSAAGLTVKPEFAELVYKPADQMSFEDYDRLFKARTRNQQLFACFVINIPDSIEGIFESCLLYTSPSPRDA